jgi:hypothetical protein
MNGFNEKTPLPRGRRALIGAGLVEVTFEDEMERAGFVRAACYAPVCTAG